MDAIPYWVAFNSLSSSRQSGMGLGYIPYSEISSYLDDQGVWDIDDRSDYRHLITMLDSKFVELKSDSKPKPKGIAKPPQKPSQRRRR